MSDVFISYARSTEPDARRIGEALRALGYGVWRDNEIPAHRSFAEVIEERLSAAKAVVVVWSAEAAASEWVRSEASRARADRKLVQLRVDLTKPPMPFDQIQCADLVGWNGEADHPGWARVADSLRTLVGQPGPVAATAPAAETAVPRGLSICVLPFVNMSGDPEQEYFSDGISEDIITDLCKVSALKVTPRNNAFTFKGRSAEVQQIARQLGVTHVLEGSVRKAGDRVRISAQLIDGHAGDHLWVERWDRDLTDIFALQDEISQAIVAALKVKLLPAEKMAIEYRGTASAEAYDLILMARNLNRTANFNAQTLEATIRVAERALALDPNYAQAWVAKAKAQSVLARRLGRSNDDGTAATERALELDPNLAEGHVLRAINLNFEGRQDESLAELELALRLGPDSTEVKGIAGVIHYENRRFDLAASLFEEVAKFADADLEITGRWVGAWVALGDMERARAAAAVSLARSETILDQDRTNGIALDNGVYALAVLGEAERAREWIARTLLIDPDSHQIRYNFACASSRLLGDTDGALEHLGRALAEDPAGDWLRMARDDPDFEPIRDDLRFRALIAEAEARLEKSARLTR
jgi:adenylate cyclase